MRNVWWSLAVSGAFLSACSSLTGQTAGSLVLTENGVGRATIVLACDASTAARYGAAELQWHVKRISGATLPIVSDDAAVTGPRILIGESAATRASGFRTADFESQEYMVRFLPGALVLMGRDTAAGEAGMSTNPTSVEGRFGKAYQFDGVRQLAVLPDCKLNDEVGSLEAWVWLPAATQERHGTILRLDGAAPWTYHIIQRDAGTSVISYTTYDGGKGHGIKSPPVTEGWHHVLGTYDAAASRMELFVDGKSVGTSSYVRTTCNRVGLRIGAVGELGGAARGNALRGVIDEVRISNVVRPGTSVPSAPFANDTDTLHLLHFDEPTGGLVDHALDVSYAPLPGIFEDRGTLDAVYDLLERFCGVRWYAPTDIGVVCPSEATLVVTGHNIRRTPPMLFRWIAGSQLYMPGPPEKVLGRDRHVWMLRMRLGGKRLSINHSFYGYYDRFLKEHPEWFAQGYETAKPPQLCYTDPECLAQVIKDARDYFDGHAAQRGAVGGEDIFGLVPMDNSQWCKCERCQAALDPAEESNPQFNNGRASEYIFDFTNKVAQEIGRTHPGRWIGQLAYSTYAYYPHRVKLEPNISVQLCLHTRNWWCPSMEANDRKVLREWREDDPGRPLYLWLYYCFPALNARSGNYRYFPGFFAHQVVRQMKLYHDAKIAGIFIENSSECGASYLMDQVEFYVTFRMAHDPDLDGNALIDEFFTRYYGAAAAPMRELYCRIEDTYSKPDCYPPEIQNSPAHQHQNEDLAWRYLGTEARMAEFAALMARAKQAAQTDIEQQRVSLFEKGIWDIMVEGRAAYQNKKTLRGQPPPQVKVPRLAVPAAGDLDKVEWDAAAPLQGWCTLSGAPAARAIDARVGHDGQFLYLQFSDPVDTSRLVSGGQIWDGDDWELFFALQRGKPYRQFAIAPDNAGAVLHWDKNSSSWDSGALSASDTSARDRWVVRVALPLAKLVPGQIGSGTRLYANFCRGAADAEGRMIWSPTFSGGFHDTTRLGELTLE